MVTDTRQRRAHIVMPAELVEEIDAQVGPRRRSRLFRRRSRELRRQRLQASLAEMAGSLADADIPGWETPEAAAEWVRALRRGDSVGVFDNSCQLSAVDRLLLDTTVLIDLSKNFGDVLTSLNALVASGGILGVCAISVAEFLAGVPVPQRGRWERWIADF